VRALLVVLLLLGGLVLAADRIAEEVAEDQVARVVADRAGLAGAPDLEFAGFPFLTQAVAGRYEDVRVSLTGSDLGQPAGARADVALRGVRVALSDVLSGSVQQVPVERVDGTVTVTYDLLSDELGPDTTLSRDGDGLRVGTTVEIGGQAVPLTATGTVSLDGDTLVVDVDGATTAGVDAPGFFVDQVSDALDLCYGIPALPFGLQVTGVTTGEDGVRIAVEATDAVLGT
jgi:hypothetical protein